MSTDIHCVWVGKKPFSILEVLSIKQYQKLDFTVNLWLYNSIENIPDGVIVHDANEIMPEDSIFKFDRPDHFGHGSVSHWSDIFQLTLLQKVGGWYSQLDVTCLKIPEDTEYYFAHHEGTRSDKTINTFIMKVPKNASFLDDCINELKQKINPSTMTNIDWLDGMTTIGKNIFKHGLSEYISTKTQECGANTLTNPHNRPNPKSEFVHWCNALFVNKNNPIPQSFYYQLLQDHNLI